MKEIIENLVKEALLTLGVNTEEILVEHPSDLSHGDYSTNAGIKYGCAGDLLQYIVANQPEGIERVEIKNGFINFFLSKNFFKQSIEEIIKKGNEFGKNENLKDQKIIIEHTQPNPFKEFHIGHLMNNAIGESIARIMKASGAEVKTATYHGDVGLHIAKAIWGMLKKEKNPYSAGVKAYEEDEEAKAEIIEINQKIYDKSDKQINDLYEAGRQKSLEHFESLYKKLNSHFDYHFYESDAGKIGKEIVLNNLEKVFEKGEGGAVIFRGEKFGLHTRVFLNSEGIPTYEAKEVGLAEIKKGIFSYDKSITITGNEQDAFFDVVEVATGEVFPELKAKLEHLSHGQLRLPTGKMSSRTGDVITAEALINEVKEKTKGDEAVAIGAIKYMILRQSIGNDIIFDIDKSVSTEGDSGVYLQYAYARTTSLLEKAKIQGVSLKSPKGDTFGRETHEIEKLLYRFPEIVEYAGEKYAPNYITTYLTELAGAFNNFYAHEQVIPPSDRRAGSDDSEYAYRLAIVEAFRIVMKNGLDILGIPAPERM